MKFFEKIGRAAESVLPTGSLESRSLGAPLYSYVDGVPFSSGTDLDKALSVPTAFACVRVNADAVMSMPISAYRVIKKRKVEVDKPSWLTNPFGNLSDAQLINQLVVSLMIDGNAYCAIVRDGQGIPTGLVPLNPEFCDLFVDPKDNIIKLRVSGQYKTTVLGFGEYIHIPWIILPGNLAGLSPIKSAKAAINLASAAQEVSATYLKNGSMPSLVVTLRGDMSEEAVKNFRNMWNQMHQGASNVGKIATMVDGTDIKPLSFSAKDSQFLESRRLQVAELARIWGVPPHAIGDASGSTSWGSGLAEQQTGWVNVTLGPIAMRIENALTEVWASYQARHVVSLDRSPLLLDSKSAMEMNINLKNAGIITVNESRRRAGYSEIDDPKADELGSSPSASLPPAEEKPKEEKPKEEIVEEEEDEDEKNS